MALGPFRHGTLHYSIGEARASYVRTRNTCYRSMVSIDRCQRLARRIPRTVSRSPPTSTTRPCLLLNRLRHLLRQPLFLSVSATFCFIRRAGRSVCPCHQSSCLCGTYNFRAGCHCIISYSHGSCVLISDARGSCSGCCHFSAHSFYSDVYSCRVGPSAGLQYSAVSFSTSGKRVPSYWSHSDSSNSIHPNFCSCCRVGSHRRRPPSSIDSSVADRNSSTSVRCPRYQISYYRCASGSVHPSPQSCFTRVWYNLLLKLLLFNTRSTRCANLVSCALGTLLYFLLHCTCLSQQGIRLQQGQKHLRS